MGSVQISTYQIVNYFLSGFVIVFSGFIVYCPCNLAGRIDRLSGNHLILGFIFSFFLGIVINAFRNTIIEDFLTRRYHLCMDKKLREKRNKDQEEYNDDEIQKNEIRKKDLSREIFECEIQLKKPYMINWDYFHKAKKEELDKMESSYYVFYSGSFNISLALFVSHLLFFYSVSFPADAFPPKYLVIASIDAAAIILLIYAIYPLKRQMIRATNEVEPLYEQAPDKRYYLKFLLVLVLIICCLVTIFFSKKADSYSSKKRMNTCDCDEQQMDTIYISSFGSLQLINSIGPFISGSIKLEKNDNCEFQKLKKNLSCAGYSEIIVIGGVDKRSPQKRAAKEFGDNLSLAQARANIVKDSVTLYYPANKEKPLILAFPKGADHYGNDSSKFDTDRCVKVYGRKKVLPISE